MAPFVGVGRYVEQLLGPRSPCPALYFKVHAPGIEPRTFGCEADVLTIDQTARLSLWGWFVLVCPLIKRINPELHVQSSSPFRCNFVPQPNPVKHSVLGRFLKIGPRTLCFTGFPSGWFLGLDLTPTHPMARPRRFKKKTNVTCCASSFGKTVYQI